MGQVTTRSTKNATPYDTSAAAASTAMHRVMVLDVHSIEPPRDEEGGGEIYDGGDYDTQHAASIARAARE